MANNISNNTPMIKIFMESVTMTKDCWLWARYTNKKGYGVFYVSGKNLAAHRFSYELFVGPIPDGLIIDHLCRTRNCVNPYHLEAVTPKVNVRRGKASSSEYNYKYKNKSSYNKGSSWTTIAERDKWICQLCFEPVDPNLKWPNTMSKSRDHIIPKSRGGTNIHTNLRLTHLSCNRKRGAKED